MKIAIDLMGGDFAPKAVIDGLSLFLHSSDAQGVEIVTIGNQDIVKPLLKESNIEDKLYCIHTVESIGYHDHPTKAFKEKPNNSIAIGFQCLAKKEADAFISAGNTGAMLVGSMFSLKPIEGILRPTIATIVPKLDGSIGLLLDVGLNVDSKPEFLNQFAILGGLYIECVFNVNRPKVALLNIGEEEGKGNLLSKSAYELLQQNKNIHFIGNVEGRDIFNDKADVIICDGFTGNVILKLIESLYTIACKRKLQEDSFFKKLHYEEYGGTPILGVEKPIIIGHGISTGKAFLNMILLAKKMKESNFCERMKDKINQSL